MFGIKKYIKKIINEVVGARVNAIEFKIFCNNNGLTYDGNLDLDIYDDGRYVISVDCSDDFKYVKEAAVKLNSYIDGRESQKQKALDKQPKKK